VFDSFCTVLEKLADWSWCQSERVRLTRPLVLCSSTSTILETKVVNTPSFHTNDGHFRFTKSELLLVAKIIQDEPENLE